MIVIEIDGSYGKVIGAGRATLRALSSTLSYKVQGAENSELYRKHRWDGMKHLFNMNTKKFPVGLLPIVRGVLINEQYRIVDKTRSLTLREPLECSGLDIRPYQLEAKEKALEAHRGILQVATGGGKTVIAAVIIAELSTNTLFMVHTKDLLYQAKKSFEDILGIHVGQIGDGIVDIQQVTIATTQSMATYMGVKFDKSGADKKEKPIDQSKASKILEFAQSVDLVIWDEVHRIACDMACGVAEKLPAPYKIGLSASPWRDDGNDMLIQGYIGNIVYKLSASDLISQGYLVRPIIKMEYIESNGNLMDLTYDQVYKKQVVDNHARNLKIVDLALGLLSRGIPTLILVKQIKHGKDLQKIFREKFGEVRFLSGNDISTYRNQTIEMMKEGTIDILIASTIADEGLDIPVIGGIILAGGGKSTTRALQRIGRAIRLSEGKTEAIIYDLVDQAPYLLQQGMQRKNLYKSEEEFVIYDFK